MPLSMQMTDPSSANACQDAPLPGDLVSGVVQIPNLPVAGISKAIPRSVPNRTVDA